MNLLDALFLLTNEKNDINKMINPGLKVVANKKAYFKYIATTQKMIDTTNEPIIDFLLKPVLYQIIAIIKQGNLLIAHSCSQLKL